MKIRKHRKLEWWFYPHENSDMKKKSAHIFKRKSSLMKFLNKNYTDCLGGEVILEGKSFGSSGAIRQYFVWYNQYKNIHRNAHFKIVLKQENFRGSKYIFKPSKIEKDSKKYFAFSNKVINLMCNIEDDNGIILKKDAERLVVLFKKRGFKDFEPTKEDWEYINGHISDGISFFHWSDRCGWLRTKTIIEYFKQKELI